MNIEYLEIIALISISSSLITSCALYCYCKNINNRNNRVINLDEIIVNRNHRNNINNRNNNFLSPEQFNELSHTLEATINSRNIQHSINNNNLETTL